VRLVNKIVFASNNVDKFEEIKGILSAYPAVELAFAPEIIRNADKIGSAEVYNTYLENAIAKARLVNHGSHYPSLADDTGLEVDSLNGRPGVHSFRFAKMGPYAVSKEEQNRANLELLLSEMKKSPGAPRTARFVSVVTLCIEGILIHAQGTLEGAIADAPRGNMGFGYDCLFVPQGSNKTLAETTIQEKNSISHRAKALHALMEQLGPKGIILAKP
jgi:XTP/dITP diphosphohydrolase